MHADFIRQIRRLKTNANTIFERTDLHSRVESEHLDVSRRAQTKALQDFDRRRFAGAIWPEKAEYLSRLHTEVNASNRFELAVGLVKAHHIYNWLHGGFIVTRLARP